MKKRTHTAPSKKAPKAPIPVEPSTEVLVPSRRQYIQSLAKPGAEFTKALAEEIVKGLTRFGQLTTKPFRRDEAVPVSGAGAQLELGESPILIDTSVLIDGRILPIVNSGFLTGTLLIPQFVLGEVQHIADSSDAIRRSKGRRGLEVVGKLRWQKANPMLKTKIIETDLPEIKEVDHKLVGLARKWRQQGPHIRLLTVDFNLAHLARAQNVHVLNVHDIAQALKVSLVPGEELTIKIAHAGKEGGQGVGYLADGTMVIIDSAQDKVGVDVAVVVVKIHQTPAGQLFFARLK
jgi:uncharacterized protein YacL